jgi:dynein heavy chain 2
MAQWQTVVQVPTFDLRQFLTTESETLKWKAEGLAADSLSIENALVILNSQQAPCVVGLHCSFAVFFIFVFC